MSVLVGTYVGVHMLIGTCVCYVYWYLCVLCLLVHMCAMLIGTHVYNVYWYARVLCVLSRTNVCAMAIGTHECYTCRNACVV